jgi:hypothetical protein
MIDKWIMQRIYDAWCDEKLDAAAETGSRQTMACNMEDCANFIVSRG